MLNTLIFTVFVSIGARGHRWSKCHKEKLLVSNYSIILVSTFFSAVGCYNGLLQRAHYNLLQPNLQHKIVTALEANELKVLLYMHPLLHTILNSHKV